MDGRNGDLCFFNPVGSVTTTRSAYACSDTVTIRVSDDSLQGNLTTSVTISSTTESTAGNGGAGGDAGGLGGLQERSPSPPSLP